MTDISDIQRAINDIFRLVNSGQTEQAEVACRAHMDDHPNEVNLVALLGAVLLKLGRTSDAKVALGQAIEMEPRFAKPYEDLGNLHLREGNAAEARRLLEQAIKLDGGQASAYSALANACRQSGDRTSAEEAHRKYMALSPVAKALAKLSDNHRAIVVGRYYLDWSEAELAAAFDLAPGTVKSRLSRALTNLQQHLEQP